MKKEVDTKAMCANIQAMFGSMEKAGITKADIKELVKDYKAEDKNKP